VWVGVVWACMLIFVWLWGKICVGVVLRGCGKLQGSTSCKVQFSASSQPVFVNVESVSHKDGGRRSTWQRWNSLFPVDEPERSEGDVGVVRHVSVYAVRLWQISTHWRLVLPVTSEIQLRPTSCLWASTALPERRLHEVFASFTQIIIIIHSEP